MSEFKDRFIHLLRTTDKLQGKACLKSSKGIPRYCCLGVLAEADGVLVWNDLKLEWGRIEKDFFDSTFYHGPNNELLTVSIIQPEGHKECLSRVLAMLNDEQGYTFLHIADYLETVDF